MCKNRSLLIIPNRTNVITLRVVNKSLNQPLAATYDSFPQRKNKYWFEHYRTPP
jgi:hypothetical protein